MSKDKAGKKDKLKHLDLFDMMLKQSQVFRDMVGQFQSAWVPQAPSVVIEASVGTAGAAKKPGKTAKAAPVATPTEKSAAKKTLAAKKPVVKKATASAKPAPAASKPSPRKSAGKAKSSASTVGTVAPRTAAGKTAATRRVVKKK